MSRKEMTRKEFIEKYGDNVVKFSSYYKYSFNYAAELKDGIKLMVSIGGNADEIYREEVTRDGLETVRGLDPYSGSISKNGETIESFYDY